MPTLYDNFERVRQYIDQHQADVDLSSYATKVELASYVSYAYLESKNYIDDNVNLLHGPLFVDYSTPQNDSYTLSSYSHIVAGTEDKTGVSFVATKRKCGGEDGTTYMAAFFTNSDGRSKFTHKTKISDTGVGAQSDDAFMCFNAYGFRIAYSGTEGVSANTEYEILHEGNIGNLGYVTSSDVSAMGYLTAVPNDYPTYAAISAMGYITSIPSEYVTQVELSANSYLTQHQSLNAYVLAPTVVSNPTEPYRIYNQGLSVNNQYHHFYPSSLSYANAVSANANAWSSVGTVRNYVDGRIAEIEASYISYSYLSNTINNLIWTGTSAEYAALDNYTSYQIYMIKEA